MMAVLSVMWVPGAEKTTYNYSENSSKTQASLSSELTLLKLRVSLLFNMRDGGDTCTKCTGHPISQ